MKIIYRPEIDGLRAISIISVIFYHSQINLHGYRLLQGGYIGVDIFFLISGYLITSIILKELVTTGNFSFKNFYERRIRRILPALLVVMSLSLPFAYLYLLPDKLIDFSKSILYSLSFNSNYYFYISNHQYGAENGLLKPFLHSWSLSIEEQFYIIFPLILLFIFKYFKKYLLGIITIAFFISLFIADWASKNHPLLSFYSLPTRAWEILAGSTLACYEIIYKKRSSRYSIYNFIYTSLGLILIIYPIFFFNNKISHPSFFTFFPIFGACLLVWFCHKDEFITKILSSKLFVSIGIISYSLYLWHYPVFAFDKILEFSQDNIVKKFLLVLLIILFSMCTYFFIEKPSRNRKISFKYFLTIIISLYLFLCTINFTFIKNDGYKDRFPFFSLTNFLDNPWEKLKNSNNEICFDKMPPCKFNLLANKKVFIIGDSVISTLTDDLKSRIIKKNYQFIPYTFTGCFFFWGFDQITTQTKKVDKNCNHNNFSEIYKSLENEKDSIIIFGGRLPLYLTNLEVNLLERDEISFTNWDRKFVSINEFINIESSFKNSVEKLSKDNQIILIYPIPEVGTNVPNKVKNLLSKLPKNVSEKYKDFENTEVFSTSYDFYKKRTKSSFELLDSINGKNISRVYPDKIFCNNYLKNKCVTHDYRDIFYIDSIHPSLEGAKIINDIIIEKINNIEKLK